MERISSGFRFTGGIRIGLQPAIWTDSRSRSWAANSSWNSPNSLAEVSANGWPVSVHKMTATCRGATLAPPDTNCRAGKAATGYVVLDLAACFRGSYATYKIGPDFLRKMLH